MQQGIRNTLRSHIKRAAIGAGLEAASGLKALGLMRPAAGLGAIFTLHHVRPRRPRSFDPNGHLEITPEFLDAAIRRLRDDGYNFVALADVPDIIADGGSRQPFAVFTLDDGNRNNVEHALPVFARHQVPFTVFVAKGLSEGTHGMWWETLDALIAGQERLRFAFGEKEEELDLAAMGRQAVFDLFAAHVHGTDEAEAVAAIDLMARSHGIEPLGISRALIMNSQELATLAAHPLASLGAHTVSHRAVGRLSDAEAADELTASADYVEAITGKRPVTVSYPYGTDASATPRDARLAAELGFAIGVSTRPGVISAGSSSRMLLLPRLSLNGHYQKARYASALASGIPMRLMGRGG